MAAQPSASLTAGYDNMIQFPSHEKPWLLQHLTIDPRARILVLAPHPDDFDAIGVSMRYLRDHGNPIFVGVISSGSSGVEDGFCSPPTPGVKRQVREQEQRGSCQFFNLPLSHLTFLNLEEDDQSHPHDSPSNFAKVRSYVQRMNPQVVFLPHGHDTNVTHQLTYAFYERIASESAGPITALLNRDPKTIAMRDDVFTCFGEAEAAWKGQLLRYHQSQQQRNLNTRQHGFDERILQVNRQIAKSAPIHAMYAEVFELA